MIMTQIFKSAFLYAIVLFMTQSAMADEKASLIYKSEDEIKKYILALTPIGSPAAKVLKAIKENLHIDSAEYRTRYKTPDPDPPYALRYVDGRIEVQIGSAKPLGAFPVVTDVIVRWDFDAMDRLKEVVVIKQPSGT
jgi:hypothetical protein